MLRRGFLIGLTALPTLGVGGCMSRPPLDLTAQDVQGLRLAGVEVRIPSEATISWSAAEMRFARSQRTLAADPGVEPSPTPPAGARTRSTSSAPIYPAGPQEAAREELTLALKEAFQRGLGAALAGSRPVIVELAVKRAVTWGGSANLALDLTVVDAASKRVLAAYPGLVGSKYGRGIEDGMVWAVQSAALQARAWLRSAGTAAGSSPEA